MISPPSARASSPFSLFNYFEYICENLMACGGRRQHKMLKSVHVSFIF